MAPNPKVASAFRAMKVLGISEETVKPVLKSLLKLYDKNWELIEEENYRALADAIFEYEETKVVEQKKSAERKKKFEGTDQDEDLEKEAQVNDEVERPLKRLRLRHQEGPSALAPTNACPRLGESSLITPKVEASELPETCPKQTSQEITQSPQTNIRNKGKQPISPKSLAADVTDRSQPRVRDKGKEPVTPQIVAPREKGLISGRSSQGIRIKEPIQPVLDSNALIKPKNEPFTDDVAQFEVPIAVIHPDPTSNGGDSSIRYNSIEKAHITEPAVVSGKEKIAASTSSETRTTCQLAKTSEECPADLEIASSQFGEVKISVSCNSAVGKPDFNLPSLDAVIKHVEDKCLKSYKLIDSSFSVRKLMKEICESFLELGTASNDEIQDTLVNITPSLDLLKKSAASDSPGVKGDQSVPMSSHYPAEDDSVEREVEKEAKDSGNSISNSNANSLVVVHQCEISLDNLRPLYDVNDITKGEERVRISLVNDRSSDYPPLFYYIPQNIVFQNAIVSISLSQVGEDDCCSTCFGDCLSSSIRCACAAKTGGEFAYTLEGVVKEEFLEECISMIRDSQQRSLFHCKDCPLERPRKDDIAEPCKGHLKRKFIKECWSKCGCGKQCGNRIVQRGITWNLQVFLTPEGKGWGLRTLEDLPKGVFVCEYVGEILTNAELYDRNMQRRSSGKHMYPVLLDADWDSDGVLNDEEALCLDATSYGNIARFINHRCLDANLIEIPVEVETPDHRYYHLALFTTRKIDALEELTWDYGIDFDDQAHPFKAFGCQCGSMFCRNMKRSNRSRSALVVK